MRSGRCVTLGRVATRASLSISIRDELHLATDIVLPRCHLLAAQLNSLWRLPLGHHRDERHADSLRPWRTAGHWFPRQPYDDLDKFGVHALGLRQTLDAIPPDRALSREHTDLVGHLDEPYVDACVPPVIKLRQFHHPFKYLQEDDRLAEGG